MPHRTLLSPEQRTRVFGIPTEAAEMAKHYMLSTEDLALVRTKRRLSNRLGFAVQLCALRHPGRPLERSELPPAAMLAFVANQVGADPKFVWGLRASGRDPPGASARTAAVPAPAQLPPLLGSMLRGCAGLCRPCRPA